MRVAAIELFVHVTSSRVVPTCAVYQALLHDPKGRNAQALSALEKARTLDPDFILCPGWTFVGAPPKDLARVADGATVIFEVLPQEPSRKEFSGKLGSKEGHKNNDKAFSWKSLVLEKGRIRECPPQVIALGQELNDRGTAKKLAQALMSPGRLIGEGRLLICGEANVMRFRKGSNGRECVWSPLVASSGLSDRYFEGLNVFNPAHTPCSSYMHRKRRLGPWKNIVTTANQIDYRKLKRRTMPGPTRAYVDQGPLEPEQDPIIDDGWRISLFILS